MHGMHQELKADTNRCTLMMKRAISVVLFLISVKAVPGQSLSGTVTDTGDVPVPYASVIILSVPDSSFVSGTACDSAGRFDIAKSVTSGLLWVSSVGYRDRYLHFGSGTSGFGTVRLETETGLIRNAAVTASMPLVQVRGNAMETIVEGSRLERTGTGEDLLSKIPGISVKDGKVSVFGGGSVTEVYINGRLVRNDTDLCRLESADVRSVELVRNPGARYKASAGSVIRIFTKKNKDEGFSLDNRAEIYNRFKWTASDQLGLSYRKGGMEITGSMFGRYMNHSDNKTAVEETFSDKVMTSVTTMYAPQKWVYLSPNMSFNYMFDERNSAGVRYEFSNDSGYARYDNSQSILFDGCLSELAGLGIGDGFGDNRHSFNAYYTGGVKGLDIDFNMDGYWGASFQNQRTLEHRTEVAGADSERTITNDNTVKSHLLAARLILAHPLWKGKVSFGGEFSTNDRSDIYLNKEGIVGDADMRIQENLASAFLEYSLAVGKLHAAAGLRYEFLKSDYYEYGIKSDEQSRTYHNVFPSLSVSYPIKGLNLNINYAKGIDRPHYHLLRSNITYVNKYYCETGNPYLSPSFWNRVELAASYKWISFVINYSYIKDMMIMSCSLFSESNPYVTLRSYKNMDHGSVLFSSLTLAPTIGFWSPKLDVMARKQWFIAGTPSGPENFGRLRLILNFDNSFRLPWNFRLDIDGSYISAGDDNNFRYGDCWQSMSGRYYGNFVSEEFDVD